MTGGALTALDFLQKISVQFEPMYVQKGAYFYFVDPETFNAGRDEVDLAYLDLPVLLKFRLQDRLTAPYLLAGPTFSLLISAKQGGRDSKADIKDNRESYDVGIGGGFGIFLTSEQAKVFVEGRYNYGLINIDKAAENGATLRNNGFRLLLGILL